MQVWTRPEAIDRLRVALLAICGGERTMCRAAAAEGIFCHGFRRWPESEFHDRWKRHIGTSTHLTRNQMEELADLWQLSEQVSRRDSLICDSQTAFPGACRGWNEFSDADLEAFCLDILALRVTICSKVTQSPQNAQRTNCGLDGSPDAGVRLVTAKTIPKNGHPIRGEDPS